MLTNLYFANYHLIMNKEITVKSILLEKKENDKSFVSYLTRKLKEEGFNISERQVYRYSSGKVVPKYQTLIAILNICKINLSNKEIVELIKNSEEAKNKFDATVTNPEISLKEKAPAVHKRLTLRNKDFDFLNGSNVSNDYSLELIEEKVVEIYGDDKYAFSRYIVDLINEDMKK